MDSWKAANRNVHRENTALGPNNLPIEYRNKETAARFAEKAGRIIQASEAKWSDDTRDEILKYIKFRIEISLELPIVPGWTLDRDKDSPVWIDFKYEKLPNICFCCGKFNLME